MNYKQARGAIPWKPGDEKPEATIRRLRNGEPKGMTMDKIDELIRNIETQAILLHDKSREKSLLMTDYTSSEAARATLRAEFDRLTTENERLRKALESLKTIDRFDPHVMKYLVPMIDAALRGEK